MFRFEFPIYMFIGWGVLIALVFLFLFAMRRRRKALDKLGNADIIKALMPEASSAKHYIKFGLLGLTLFFLGIAWANPQWGTKLEKTTRKSSDIYIALDLSQSMYVSDIAPNRLYRSRQFGKKLIEKLQGNRVGLILFAGNAHVHMPLTTDYAAAKDIYLESAHPGLIRTQGTSIAAALDLANLSFAETEENHKAVIVISDGENHEPAAVEAAQKAKENGILIFTVGAGTQEGGAIPQRNNSGQIIEKRDPDGEIIRSKLNEELLTEVATAGGGEYFNIIAGEKRILAALENEIAKIEKREFEERLFDEHESYFWIFLIPVLIFLVIDLLISYKRNNIISDNSILN